MFYALNSGHKSTHDSEFRPYINNNFPSSRNLQIFMAFAGLVCKISSWRLISPEFGVNWWP